METLLKYCIKQWLFFWSTFTSGVELFLWRIWRFDSRHSTFFQTGRQRKGLCLSLCLAQGIRFFIHYQKAKKKLFPRTLLMFAVVFKCLMTKSGLTTQRLFKFGVSYCFKCSPGVSQLSIFGLTLCLGLLTFDIFVSIFPSSDCLLSFSNSPFSSIETVTNLGPHSHPILDITMLCVVFLAEIHFRP